MSSDPRSVPRSTSYHVDARPAAHRKKRQPRWGRILAALVVLALLLAGGLWLLYTFWQGSTISGPDGPTVHPGDGGSQAASPSGSQSLADIQSPPDSGTPAAPSTDDPALQTLAAQLQQAVQDAYALADAGSWPQDDDNTALLANADALVAIWARGDLPAEWSASAQTALEQMQAALDGLAQPQQPISTTVPQPGDAHTIETIDGVTYVDGVLVVNKTYTVPADYGDGLTPEAQAAFDAMQAGAAADGISLQIISGYRSYERQSQIYNNYVNRDGKAAADTYSARPGHSEHQTGLAMDINSLEQSMGQAPDGIWLAAHCAEYGFILRYPKGKEDITGYMYEPWHVRYLGIDLATAITDSGLTLEEYFGLTSVYADE